MTLVVDVSVAIKWVLPEADSAKARDAVVGERLVAPDFLMLECANVLAQKVRRGLMDHEAARAGLRWIEAAGVILRSSATHVAEAQRLAMDLQQSAYDALYLAVALAEAAPLLTADQRFADAAQPAYPTTVRRL